MAPTNAELLDSQEALSKLVQADLKGIYALRLKEIVSDVEERLMHLQEVHEETDTDEEWREVLQDEMEIDEDPLPKEAFEGVEISAQDLIALDFMIE
jgi:hypothetical protein